MSKRYSKLQNRAAEFCLHVGGVSICGRFASLKALLLSLIIVIMVAADFLFPLLLTWKYTDFCDALQYICKYHFHCHFGFDFIYVSIFSRGIV